ncbi:MAG: 3'-5' exonuclease [Saprospiraceae bacterium]|nr:3'-5' exonuclease [Saprospiraceae bacterium]
MITLDFIKNDLVFLDIEATGANFLKDRIIQLAMIKYKPGTDEPEEWNELINPGIPISAEAYGIHQIDAQALARKPSFGQLAEKIIKFIGGADLAAYNSYKLDIPILMEEFDRAGIQWEIKNRKIIDIQRIFHKMEPRTLKAALKFYCNKDLESAHNALADTRAIVDIFKGQIKRYENAILEDEDGKEIPAPIQRDIKMLHEFTNDQNMVDITHRLKYNAEGAMVFNFGKYNGQPVIEVFKRDRHFYHWIQSKEFSVQVKSILRKVYQENIDPKG